MEGAEASPWLSLLDCNDKVSVGEGSGMVSQGELLYLSYLQPLCSLQLWVGLPTVGRR